MDKIEKIKDWLKPYLKKDKVRDEHEEGFFHCAMLLNDFLDTLEEELPENLDEAAEEYGRKEYSHAIHFWDEGLSKNKPEVMKEDFVDAFKAGAEWQKVQMMNLWHKD